ncbi:hypothetical protein Tco_1049997 [Tanacetum coccineum]
MKWTGGRLMECGATKDDQVIHTRIRLKRENKEVFCSFIYAHNEYQQRRIFGKLLALLMLLSIIVLLPFLLTSIASLFLRSLTLVLSVPTLRMRAEFKECVNSIDVVDVNRSGLHFTWNQKPKGILESILAICTNVIRLRDDLDRVQTLLDQDPFNINIREQEALTVADFNQAVIMEEHFLRQKAKVQWLKEGDSNSAYFHKTVKSNACRGRIDAITTSNGVILTDDNVSAAFVSHYESFLGQSDQPSDLNDTDLFEVCIVHEQVEQIWLEVLIGFRFLPEWCIWIMECCHRDYIRILFVSMESHGYFEVVWGILRQARPLFFDNLFTLVMEILRIFHREAFNFNSKVSDIVQNGVVVWPRFLSDKYAVLSTCTAAISNVRDSILWRLSDGSTTAFSVSQVWNSIRPRDDKIVLAGGMLLPLSDLLALYVRLFYFVFSDSHEHLFFDCPFAAQVWNHMKSKAGLDNVPNDVYAIIIHVGTGAKRSQQYCYC